MAVEHDHGLQNTEHLDPSHFYWRNHEGILEKHHVSEFGKLLHEKSWEKQAPTKNPGDGVEVAVGKETTQTESETRESISDLEKKPQATKRQLIFGKPSGPNFSMHSKETEWKMTIAIK